MAVAARQVLEPDDITSLAVRLDAQNAASFTYSTGADISQWGNNGTEGVGHAIQGTGSAQPLYVADSINGYPGVQFYDDSTAKHLAIADVAALNFSAYTFFTVQNLSATLVGSAQVVHGKWTATGNQREFQSRISGSSKATNFYSTNGTAETGPSTTDGITAGTPCILSGYWDGSSVIGTRVNLGAEVQSTGIASVFNGTSPYYIGAHTAGLAPYAGFIGEILFYTKLLTSTERHQLIYYLANKWSITV